MSRRVSLVCVIFMLVLSGICLIVCACSPTSVCGVCGTYVNQDDPSEFLELKSDGTYYLEEGGMGFTGTWEVDGDTITLTLLGAFAARGEIRGNTIIDNEGKVWVKQ